MTILAVGLIAVERYSTVQKRTKKCNMWYVFGGIFCGHRITNVTTIERGLNL